MKLALVGYGRMGKAVERQAVARGHAVVAVFDENHLLQGAADLEESEVLIDFSLAAAVPSILKIAARAGKPVVEGTTGWASSLEAVQRIPGLTMVYSPNFSVGVYQFMRLVSLAGSLLGAVGGFDAFIHEWHHAGKADSPSGTARRLAAILLDAFPQKSAVLEETSHGVIAASQLHVTSTRAGRIPGIHEVGFDSETERITLRHEALGRDSFALGAVLAAEWIRNRSGIHTMDDFMSSLAKGEV